MHEYTLILTGNTSPNSSEMEPGYLYVYVDTNNILWSSTLSDKGQVPEVTRLATRLRYHSQKDSILTSIQAKQLTLEVEDFIYEYASKHGYAFTRQLLHYYEEFMRACNHYRNFLTEQAENIYLQSNKQLIEAFLDKIRDAPASPAEIKETLSNIQSPNLVNNAFRLYHSDTSFTSNQKYVETLGTLLRQYEEAFEKTLHQNPVMSSIKV